MPVTPNPIVAGLPATVPFVSPEEIEARTGKPFRARLGANEGNRGCSPAAAEAIARAVREDVWKYPVPPMLGLRAQIGAHWGLEADTVTIGNGIDNLLGVAVRIFSDVGDGIVTSLGAYPTFAYHVHGHGRRLVSVPFGGAHEDLDGLCEAAHRERAAIVYVSNPDNPMGSWHDSAAIVRFARALPDTTLLILDEAYGETAPDDALPNQADLPAKVLRMRSFSKAYALAGLRVGYAIGVPDLIGQFDKVRDHFGVHVLGVAAASAALADQAWLTENVTAIAAARARIAQIGAANRLTPLPSATNFVTFDTGGDAAHAMALLQALGDEQVFIRKPMAPGLDHCIRISTGRPEELDWLEQALPRALARLD